MEPWTSFAVLVLFLGAMSPSEARDCVVRDKKSNEDKSCVFPFVFNRVTYNECTDKDDAQGKFWCSTK